MKDILKEMDRAFDSRVRIAIIALLLQNEWTHFNDLKESLGITEGNLASHIANLDRKSFIEVNKKFVANRPHTSYKISEKGKEAYQKYIHALKKLLNIK